MTSDSTKHIPIGVQQYHSRPIIATACKEAQCLLCAAMSYLLELQTSLLQTTQGSLNACSQLLGKSGVCAKCPPSLPLPKNIGEAQPRRIARYNLMVLCLCFLSTSSSISLDLRDLLCVTVYLGTAKCSHTLETGLKKGSQHKAARFVDRLWLASV